MHQTKYSKIWIFFPPLLIQIAIFGSKEEQCVSMLDHVLFVYAYFQLEQDLCRD